jgi:hypothetical protein
VIASCVDDSSRLDLAQRYRDRFKSLLRRASAARLKLEEGGGTEREIDREWHGVFFEAPRQFSTAIKNVTPNIFPSKAACCSGYLNTVRHHEQMVSKAPITSSTEMNAESSR